MKTVRLTLSALVLSSLASVSVAQSASDHNAHHPTDALTKSEAPIGASSKTADAAPLLNQMDAHIENMQRLHQEFQIASPDERRSLMTKHHAMMQEAMKLMGAASNRSNDMSMMDMGGMRGSGMMGGMDRSAVNQSAAPGPHMAQGMMQHHELMSKRMDMMQSMMRMMMDRMDAGN